MESNIQSLYDQIATQANPKEILDASVALQLEFFRRASERLTNKKCELHPNFIQDYSKAMLGALKLNLATQLGEQYQEAIDKLLPEEIDGVQNWRNN